jgi:Glycosyltransferase family 87
MRHPAWSRGARVHTRWAVWAVITGLIGYFAFLTCSALGCGRYKDFWEFFLAAQEMRRGADFYSVGKDGYIYPPLLAFLLMPLVPLGLNGATILWLILNVTALLVSAFVGARIMQERLRASRQRSLIPAAVALALALNADKLHAEFVFGQCNLWMLLAWTLGLLWLDQRPVAAGIALGFGANLKYLTLAAVPYMLIRGRYKAAAATVGAAAAWGLLPALYLGWDWNVAAWRRALGGLTGMVYETARTGPAARITDIKGELSYSITSWAVRATSEGGPNLATFALLAVVLGALLGAVWWIYRAAGLPLLARAGRSYPAGVIALEWVGVLAMTLAFGPQTNSRHLTMLVLATVAAGVLALSPGCRVARWPLWAGLAVLEAGLILPPGADRFRGAIEAWRWAGGVSWCLVVMYLTLLWVGQRHVLAAAGARRADRYRRPSSAPCGSAGPAEDLSGGMGAPVPSGLG